VVRSPRHFFDALETQAKESVQYPFRVDIPAELTQKRRRHQSYVLAELGALVEPVSYGNLGLVGTDANALPAVDAPLLEDVRLAFSNPDRLGRATLYAVGTSLALFAVEGD
jgi:hypothetical protein